MKLGVVINETWAFFNEIYADFAAHHPTRLYQPKTIAAPLFKERLNRYYSAQHLRSFLRSNDVVFFEWASELLVAATHLPKTCGIVTRLHRYELYQWADRVRWEGVDKIILVSQAKRREFLSRFPELASKVVVIPEAIDPDKFRPHPKPFSGQIGILCHLSPRKRVYEVILAFAELAERPDLHLHIGGGRHPRFPEYADALRMLTERLGLQERITFYDHVANPAEWYARVDVVISNSYSEGLQVAPMEAIASGCYCLSHWWDGADELLPSENLFHTERELGQKIIEYSEVAEAERQARCERLRERVRDQFDVNKTKVQIREVVEHSARSRNGQTGPGL